MTNGDPIDTAWRIHAAIADWTGKVDSKAAFTLTLESATMAAVVTLSGGGRALSDLAGWRTVFYVTGTALLAIAIVCAGWAVIPRLRRVGNLKAEAGAGNFIYFGHLRHLEPDDIADFITRTDLLPILALQLKNTSDIAWKKHRRVQLSMGMAVVGVAAVAAAGLWP